jgi:hypothetical protein
MRRSGFGTPAGASLVGYFLCSSSGAVTTSNQATASSGMGATASALANQEFARGNAAGTPPSITTPAYFLQSWGVSSQGNELVVRVDLYALSALVAPPAPPGWIAIPVSSLPLPVAIAFAEGAQNPAPSDISLPPGTTWRQVWTSNGMTYGAVATPGQIVGAYQYQPRAEHVGGGNRRPGLGNAPGGAPQLGDELSQYANALIIALANSAFNNTANPGVVDCNDPSIQTPVQNFQVTFTAACQSGGSQFGPPATSLLSGTYDLATQAALQKTIDVYVALPSFIVGANATYFQSTTAPVPCTIVATSAPIQGLPPPAVHGTPTPAPVPILRLPPNAPPPFLHLQPISMPGAPIISQPAQTAAPAAATASTALGGAGVLGGLGLLAYAFLRR